MKKILFALLMSTSALSYASDWQYFGMANGTLYYVDFGTMADVGNYRKAWFRGDLTEQREVEGSYPKKKWQSSKILYYFDCKAKLIGAFQEVLYEMIANAGAVASTKSTRFDPKSMDDVVPDSVGEKMMGIICGPETERDKIRASNQADKKEFERFMKEREQTKSSASGTPST